MSLLLAVNRWFGDRRLVLLRASVTGATVSVAGAPDAVEKTLWRAAAHSGDSDSTAAITGNLLGAMLGAGGLPKRWLETLELRDVIERLATDLHRATILEKDLDTEAYPPN